MPQNMLTLCYLPTAPSSPRRHLDPVLQISQLLAIFRVMGTPSEAAWPGVSKLRDWNHCFPTWQPRDLAEVGTAHACLRWWCVWGSAVDRRSSGRVAGSQFVAGGSKAAASVQRAAAQRCLAAALRRAPDQPACQLSGSSESHVP